jgi:peptidoglycan/LPS O-acetylase OafA/YrhL
MRLASIDALRGIAALAVVLFHAAMFVPFVGADNLAGRALAEFLNLGFSGVYLFFVISGFCIHLRYCADGKQPGFLAFWKRRIRRLYPGYAAALAIYVAIDLYVGVLQPTRHLALDIGLHATLLHNLLPSTTYSISGLFWTLAIEEQLYLAYFLLLALRRRMSWSAILTLTLLIRVGWFALGFAVHRKLGLEMTVSESAAATWFCWVLGALAVEAAYGIHRLPEVCYSYWAGLAVLLVTAAIHRLAPAAGAFHNVAWLVTQPLWSFGYFFIVNSVVRAEKNGARLPLALTFVGGFSYSLYLTHDIMTRHVAHGWSTTVRLLVAVPICLVMAWLFYWVFERPFLTAKSARS